MQEHCVLLKRWNDGDQLQILRSVKTRGFENPKFSENGILVVHCTTKFRANYSWIKAIEGSKLLFIIASIFQKKAQKLGFPVKNS